MLLSADWLGNSSELWGRVSTSAGAGLRGLAEPERARRLRWGLMLLFGAWAVIALARLLWGFVPGGDMALPEQLTVVNPVITSQRQPTAAADTVDLGAIQDWHLFGTPVAPTEGAAEQIAQELAEASGREGIEKGARETRLALKLRGAVASSEDGLGHAVIEHKKRQQVYAVEDKLPVPGQVFLAKVMPRQVVLDNGGTYELLRLFEESQLDKQLEQAPRPTGPAPKPQTTGRNIDRRQDAGTTRLAQSYRQRLYQNPQSLAEVVRVTAVREGGELRGYRVGPGADAAQFEQLGFRAGDLVTGVNGIPLDDPANTMRLYQAMRGAAEATFELQRGGEQISLSVNLGESDGGH